MENILRYKIDVIKSLKDRGYTTYRLRKERIIGENTLQKIREGKIVTPQFIDILCKYLECQPGDIIEYVPEM